MSDDVGTPGRGDEVALAQPGAFGRTVGLDSADEHAVALGQPDRLAHPPSDVPRGGADAEQPPSRFAARGQGVDPLPQGRSGGLGDREAVTEAQGGDAEQAAVAVDDGTARAAAGQGSGVLDAAGDQPAAGAAERPAGRRHRADRDPMAVGDAGHGEHGRAQIDLTVAPLQGRGVARIHRQHHQIGVDVDTLRSALQRRDRRRR